MLCCALLLGSIAFVLRRGPASDPFPPPARRDADGLAAPGAANVAADEPPRDRRTAGVLRPAIASAARWAAAGVALYAAAISLMLAAGAAMATQAPAERWLLRDALFALAATVCFALGTRAWRSGRVTAPGIGAVAPSRAACALIGVGAAWFVGGLADMHVFALFEVGEGAPLADVFFHGSGIWAMAAGAYLLRRAPQRRGKVAC